MEYLRKHDFSVSQKMRNLLLDALPCPDSIPRFQCGDNQVHILIIWQRRPEPLEPWTFLCIGTTLTLASLEAKCRSNPTTAQTSSPEATLRCNDYSINYYSAPAFHMRDIHPPSLFSRDGKPRDKGLEKCQKLRHPFFRNCVTLLQNCTVYHIFVKNVLFIHHHMTRIGFMRNS